MQWAQLEQRQPGLAERARQRLVVPGVLLVGTARADGTVRISPVEPLLLDGELWLSMLWDSRKARDLRRDPRVLVHSVVTSRDGREGELKVRGLAEARDDHAEQTRYQSEVARQLGWEPTPGHFHLFTVDIRSVVSIRYDDSTGDQYVASWPPGSEFVRRGTSATSLSEPEPWVELLVDE
jgi:hypothetical protein